MIGNTRGAGRHPETKLCHNNHITAPPSFQNILNGSLSLTLNGATKAPDFFFVATDCKAATWADRAGNNDTNNVGTNPTLSQPGPFDTSVEDLVVIGRFEGGQRYSSAGDAAIGTKDWVWEFVAKASAGAGQQYVLFANFPSNASEGGTAVRNWGGLKAFQVTCRDKVVPATKLESESIAYVDGDWHHYVIGCNRDGITSSDWVCIVDGEYSAWDSGHTDPTPGAALDFSPSGTLFTMLGWPNSAFVGWRSPDCAALAAQWTGAAWLANGAACRTELTAWAHQRFMAITGGTGTWHALGR